MVSPLTAASPLRPVLLRAVAEHCWAHEPLISMLDAEPWFKPCFYSACGATAEPGLFTSAKSPFGEQKLKPFVMGSMGGKALPWFRVADTGMELRPL